MGRNSSEEKEGSVIVQKTKKGHQYFIRKGRDVNM